MQAGKSFLLGVLAFFCLLSSPLMALDIERWVTSKGTKVSYVYVPTPNIVDVQIDFPAGAVFDPIGKEGLASLTLDALPSGAKNLSEEAVLRGLADTAAQWNFGVERERGSVTLRVLATPSVRDDAVGLLAQLFANPTFPAAALQREKAREIASLEDAETQPEFLANKNFSEALYGKSAYGRMATAKSVRAIERQDLVNFFKAHVIAKGAALTIVGNISREDAQALAERLTAGLSVGSPVAATVTIDDSNLGKTIVVPHPASQAHLLMGAPLLTYNDPDNFPLAVGNYILGGGGFVSRLMKIIREKEGMAYSVFSTMAPMTHKGPFQIGLQTKKENTDRAIQLVRQTLDEFLRDGPTDEEVESAKKNIADGFVLRLDNNRKLLSYIGAITFFDLPQDWLERYPERVRAVTREQIIDAFRRRVSPDRLVTVVVAGAPS